MAHLGMLKCSLVQLKRNIVNIATGNINLQMRIAAYSQTLSRGS